MTSGVKNKGGLTVGLEPGESVKVGDNIEIMIQKNCTPGCKTINLRIVAPEEFKITRSNDKGEERVFNSNYKGNGR